MYSTIRVATSPRELTLTLDRPARRNALDDTMIRELEAALDLAEATPSCRLVILRGAGGVFCTGMDLEDAAQGAEDGTRHRAAGFFRLLRRLQESSRVVVALVDGKAEGGGVGLVAASDFVFASPRARFGLPEALWGLLPSSVLPFLIRRVGPRTAYSMTLSTLPLDATEAQRCGLVDVVSDEPSRPLRALAGRVTKIDPSTVIAVKRSFARLAPISSEVELAALREFDDLFTSPLVQRALAGMRGPDRSFPWER